MDPAHRASVLDQDVIATLKDLGGEDEPELFMELVDLFIDDTRSQLDQVSAALTRGDTEEMRRRAHTLKSSCANVGAVHMAQSCFQMEQLAVAAELHDIEGLLAKVLAEFDQVKAALLSEKS